MPEEEIDLPQHVGNPHILRNKKIALLCSIKCPGSIILRTYDLMRDLRTRDVTVISGFRSPMERQCLNLLLRGTCGVVVCFPNRVPKRLSADLKKALNDGRAFLCSVPTQAGRATRKTAAECNRAAAAMADAVFVPYASPKGMTERICRELVQSSKPLFTFEGEHGTLLEGIGARAISVSSAVSLLEEIRDQGLPKATKSPESAL